MNDNEFEHRCVTVLGCLQGLKLRDMVSVLENTKHVITSGSEKQIVMSEQASKLYEIIVRMQDIGETEEA